MAPQRPLQNFKTTAPALCFMYEFETWQAYWRYQDVQKSLLEQYPKSNRKSAILKLMCKFGDIFPSFQASYFDELLQGISLDLRDLLCVESKDLGDVKLRSFLRSGKRGGHGGTWSFNYSPKSSNLLSLKNTMSISPKGRRRDETRARKCLLCHLSVMVRAPPSGTTIIMVEWDEILAGG